MRLLRGVRGEEWSSMRILTAILIWAACSSFSFPMTRLALCHSQSGSYIAAKLGRPARHNSSWLQQFTGVIVSARRSTFHCANLRPKIWRVSAGLRVHRLGASSGALRPLDRNEGRARRVSFEHPRVPIFPISSVSLLQSFGHVLVSVDTRCGESSCR